ncbi:hypothetical protein YW7DRAFT_05181 [Streptomyces sp. AmelKG-E11A]|nr:hypothetical protein YW7DRAFT_05181 [Streptomyces sp. AmelKG-E11A]
MWTGGAMCPPSRPRTRPSGPVGGEGTGNRPHSSAWSPPPTRTPTATSSPGSSPAKSGSAAPWTSSSAGGARRAADRPQDVLEAGALVGVAARQHESERAAPAVAGQVELGAQSSTGSTEDVFTGFVPVACPFSPPAACLRRSAPRPRRCPGEGRPRCWCGPRQEPCQPLLLGAWLRSTTQNRLPSGSARTTKSGPGGYKCHPTVRAPGEISRWTCVRCSSAVPVKRPRWSRGVGEEVQVESGRGSAGDALRWSPRARPEPSAWCRVRRPRRRVPREGGAAAETLPDPGADGPVARWIHPVRAWSTVGSSG